MHHIKQSKTVIYPAKEMYNLVDNIKDYQQFLPWCQRSEEHERDDESVVASLAVAVGGFHKTFTTKNLLYPYSLIELQLVEGPFNHLDGFWRFTDLAEGSRIDFELSFEVENKILSMLITPFFEKASMVMIDSFCQQAEARYGTSEY